MNCFKPIHQITEDFKITSRALRHWEEKGLIESQRDVQSGWRIYSPETLIRIKLIKVLRELDIPIQAIKSILYSSSIEVVSSIITDKINKLKEEDIAINNQKDLLDKCLSVLSTLKPIIDNIKYLENVEELLALQIITENNIMKEHKEDIIMTNNAISSGALRIVRLPEMRVAVCNIVSASPEEEALSTITNWLETECLESTARIFGFNTTAYSPGTTEYGWAACASVPQHVKIPDNLTEKSLPGGLYASLNSTNEVYDSWQTLIRLLKKYDDYEVDNTRPCLEEHIRSGEDTGTVNDFYINLLEPITKK